MNGVFVKFRYSSGFDQQALRKIAESARALFEGMPGLRSKAFTLNAASHEAVNFYVWESEDAAKAFFTDDGMRKITNLYGIRPEVQFVDIAALVENGRS